MPRVGEMPHNGYRAFDIKLFKKVYPDYIYSNIDEGITQMLNIKKNN